MDDEDFKRDIFFLNHIANGHAIVIGMFIAGLVLGAPFAVAAAFGCWATAYFAQMPATYSRPGLYRALHMGILALTTTGVLSVLANLVGLT